MFKRSKTAAFRFLLVSILLSSPCVWAAERYYTPPAQFSAAFQIMDMGLANVFGLFSNATGSFVLGNDGKSVSAIKVAIDASSLTLANGKSSDELQQLFAVSAFPEIVFKSAAASILAGGKGSVIGTLTVHGVSKPAVFEATVNQLGSGSSRAAGLSLRGSFKRADFSMGDAPDQPGRFGDSVTLLLDMQAVRQ